MLTYQGQQVHEALDATTVGDTHHRYVVGRELADPCEGVLGMTLAGALLRYTDGEWQPTEPPLVRPLFVWTGLGKVAVDEDSL